MDKPNSGFVFKEGMTLSTPEEAMELSKQSAKKYWEEIEGREEAVELAQRKRDRFELAKAAMQGLLAGGGNLGGHQLYLGITCSNGAENPRSATSVAIEMADDLLSKLEATS